MCAEALSFEENSGLCYRGKLTQQERQARIERALQENVNFAHDASLGYPASKLDSKVFNNEAPFLKTHLRYKPTLPIRTISAVILSILPKRLLAVRRKWNAKC